VLFSVFSLSDRKFNSVTMPSIHWSWSVHVWWTIVICHWLHSLFSWQCVVWYYSITTL